MNDFDPDQLMTNAPYRTFAEIEARVKVIRKDFPNRRIWDSIEEPITTDSIDSLIEDGWVVKTEQDTTYSRPWLTEIGLQYGLRGFERDRALFHEIVHAWLGKEASDNMLARFRDDNNTIVEHLARQLRANPEILRHSVLAFNLEPEIYDSVSHQAFADYHSLSPYQAPHAATPPATSTYILMELQG
jgi:hypothetical protein